MSRLRTRWVRVGLAVAALTLTLGGLLWGTFQPWTANHFGYALPGKDGLPTYLFARGRRYHTEQVCAGAGWCVSDRQKLALPRCYTQADLQRMQQWPLVKYGDMVTLFQAPQPIYVHSGSLAGLTTPFVMADGDECYVVYGLEGGP